MDLDDKDAEARAARAARETSAAEAGGWAICNDYGLLRCCLLAYWRIEQKQ